MILEKEFLKQFPEYDNHEMVMKIDDENSGLKGFIAIHNMNLGPAVGGTRVFIYASETDALRDALRLSRAMSYKCALADLNHGGGKGVIICNPDEMNNEKLKTYAKIIKDLEGKFYTGEDVGLTNENVQYMLKYSPYFIGKENQAGDPSPFAALSVFEAIKASVKIQMKKNNLKGIRVAIKGTGKVGGELVRLLIQEGCEVVISDIKEEIIKTMRTRFPKIRVVESDEIHKQDVDIYAPCALGLEFNSKNISSIKAKIICGAANNQLESEEIGDALFRQGILYIVDYLANSGGLINVADELDDGGYNIKRVTDRIMNVKKITENLIKASQERKEPTNRIANKISEKTFLAI